MSQIKERIFANWKTTTLGIGVLIAGLVLVYLEKASLAELTAFVSGALVLLISKDGKYFHKNKFCGVKDSNI